jgi:hypothetical protein
LEEKLRLEKRLNDGANWFYAIAGLSIINSIIFLAGGNFYFVIGLGISQLIDGIAVAVAGQTGQNAGLLIKMVAFGLDILIAIVFVLFGFFARRHKWIYVVGMIIYALDGFIFLIGPDLLSIGFHLLALYGLYNGLKAYTQIKQGDSAIVV